ncbi:MAG: 4Fe-4S binding protein [Candidatus Sumerlaeota bacterium]|nr:4Fe-4S binding protein [Candidatus Sumerlaeota bacterium]
MIGILTERLKQKNRTIAFPDKEPTLPDRFRGRPEIDFSRCAECDSRACGEACPTGAIADCGLRIADSNASVPSSQSAIRNPQSAIPGSQSAIHNPQSPVPNPQSAIRNPQSLDLGKCIFCGECAQACSRGAIRFTQDYRLAARKRKDLILTSNEIKLAEALDAESRRLFGRSLKLRQVSAGGCNACEADINVLTTVVFDLGRFGIQIVASPRHADGLIITGPVTENMQLALKKTFDAVPEPRIVIAVGACAISGGIYGGHPESHNGADGQVPADLYIPGCPPHPITILDGLLRLLGRR